MIDSRHSVAVVGASGAVGRELLALLAARGLRPERLLGSRDRVIETPHGTYQQTPLAQNSFTGVEMAFFCAPSLVAREQAAVAVDAGCLVVDNSSAFRLDKAVPLVVPEVNGEALHGLGDGVGLVANPNCSTIILLMAIAPLHRAFGCERLDVTTYQAVSGAGSRAMEELRRATRADLEGRHWQPTVFKEPVAFNVFSHDSEVDAETGYNGEETKIVREVAKILEDPPAVTATCLRVPVMRSHCEAVTVTLQRSVTEAELQKALEAAPGVRILDDREANRFPTAREAVGSGEVLVGRIRPDRSRSAEDSAGTRWRSFHLLIAGDQLLKGAALNALQIGDMCMSG